MLSTARLTGSTRLLAAAMAMLATSPSAGPVVVRNPGFEQFGLNWFPSPVFLGQPKEGKRPRRVEQSARLKAKRRGH
jgi:hypothetical protein